MKRISSDLHCELLDLSREENITQLWKNKKIEKIYSPRLSVEIPVVSANVQKPYLHVHNRDTETASMSFSCALVFYMFTCVFLCGQIGPDDTPEFMNAASQGKLKVINKYLADGGNPNVHDEVSVKQINVQQFINLKTTNNFYL